MRPVGPKTVESRMRNAEWRIDALERRIPPSSGLYEIKVFADEDALDGSLPASARIVATGDGKFIWAIPYDLDTYYLTSAEAFVTTVSSSGLVTVQIRNITDSVDILSTRITIDAGDFTSYAAATPSVVNPSNNRVDTGDRLSVDVDTAGTGAQGLGVIVRFSTTNAVLLATPP